MKLYVHCAGPGHVHRGFAHLTTRMCPSRLRTPGVCSYLPRFRGLIASEQGMQHGGASRKDENNWDQGFEQEEREKETEVWQHLQPKSWHPKFQCCSWAAGNQIALGTRFPIALSIPRVPNKTQLKIPSSLEGYCKPTCERKNLVRRKVCINIQLGGGVLSQKHGQYVAPFLASRSWEGIGPTTVLPKPHQNWKSFFHTLSFLLKSVMALGPLLCIK